MYAIETYFIAPSNTCGPRIKARVMEGRTAAGGAARSITLPWDHAKNPDGNHAAACAALASGLGWAGEWISGGAADGANVWVNASRPGGVPSVLVLDLEG